MAFTGVQFAHSAQSWRVVRKWVSGVPCLPVDDLVFVPPTPRRPCNRMRAVHLASRPTSVVVVSLGLRLFSVPLQTFQHLCSRSHLPTVHTGLPGNAQKSTSAHVQPWLRWRQACPQARLQRRESFENGGTARSMTRVDPSRCSSHSVPDAMIPETRATQLHTRTQRRRARGRGRRQGRGHGHRGAGQEGH